MTARVDCINASPADPYAFIAEHTAHCAYWADLAREAAAYARAFVGVVRDYMVERAGGAE